MTAWGSIIQYLKPSVFFIENRRQNWQRSLPYFLHLAVGWQFFLKHQKENIEKKKKKKVSISAVHAFSWKKKKAEQKHRKSIKLIKYDSWSIGYLWCCHGWPCEDLCFTLSLLKPSDEFNNLRAFWSVLVMMLLSLKSWCRVYLRSKGFCYWKMFFFSALIKDFLKIGMGNPWWLRWLKICLQWRSPGLDSWVRKIPWRRE